jgi:hypothetical protein
MKRINSARQSIAAAQRTTSYRFPTPTIVGRKALVYQARWTKAPVIKTTINKDFKLHVYGVDVKVGDIVQRASIQLRAGQTIYFTRAETPVLARQGYYYITVEENETIEGAPAGIGCTCVAGLQFDMHCHHHDDVAAFVARGIRTMVRQADDPELAAAFEHMARTYEAEAAAACTHKHKQAKEQ